MPAEPAGVLIGFEVEDDWFDYRLETIGAFCAGSKKRALVSRPGAEYGWGHLTNQQRTIPKSRHRFPDKIMRYS